MGVESASVVVIVRAWREGTAVRARLLRSVVGTGTTTVDERVVESTAAAAAQLTIWIEDALGVDPTSPATPP